MPISVLNVREFAVIPASYSKLESMNTMVTADFRPELEIRQFRARALKKYAI